MKNKAPKGAFLLPKIRGLHDNQLPITTIDNTT